jgi:pimeloyl-ACP methyl ester carboxylesterase
MIKTQFVTSTDGTRIAYDVTGQGPFLMLLHGAGKDRRDWHKQGYVERLKEEYTVITIDFRGSGESDFLVNVDDYAIENICQDLDSVAEACQAQQYAIWGYSFGGIVALFQAIRSHRVTAIAVIGVPLDRVVDEEFNLFIDEFVKKWGALAEAYKTDALDQSKQRAAIKGRIPALVACFQAMRKWREIDPKVIPCPMMLLTGTKNRSATNWIKSNGALLEAKKVQVDLLEGLNHPQEFSCIDKVFPPVSMFLKKHT